MDFDIDWVSLNEQVNPPTSKALDFSKVAHKFRKVAFDTYEKIGEQGLWELKENEDGTKVLVALYEDQMVATASVVKSSWTASATRAGDSVTMQFKGIPVAKFAGKEFGFETNEANKFSTYIAGVANRDSDFVNKLANSLNANQRAFLLDLVSSTKGE